MKPTKKQTGQALDRLYSSLEDSRAPAGWVDDLALLEQAASQRDSLLDVCEKALATFEHHKAELTYLDELSVVKELRMLLAIGEKEDV